MTDDALDLLVALNVAGWRRIGLDDWCRPLHAPSKDFPGKILNLDGKGPHERLIPPDCEFDEQDDKCVWLCGCDKGAERVPYYSTDIAAAFEVVEEMRKRGQFLALDISPSVAYAYFSDGMARRVRGPDTNDRSTARAICLAALAALKVAVAT